MCDWTSVDEMCLSTFEANVKSLRFSQRSGLISGSGSGHMMGIRGNVVFEQDIANDLKRRL